ncbi:MAG: chemotaxis protein CheW [Geobacteraceae bacterium]
MNLAEIRKKALKEKSTVQPIPPAGEETPGKCDEGAEVPIVDFIAIEYLQAPPVTGEGEGVVKEPLPIAFDPLSLLLAGRDSGCGEEEMLLASSVGSEHGGEESQQFLCFRVADEKYAVNIMDIKEIIRSREVTKVPRASVFITGVLSLRGIIIPLFDLRKRLGLASAGETGKERIIVVKKDEEFCGVLVDEVIQVARIAESTIEQPPAVLYGIDRDFVNGTGRVDNQMLILLNLEKILNVTLC